MVELSDDSTPSSLLETLPAELSQLQPVSQHLTLVEYRRKHGDTPPKLQLLPVTQKLLELTRSWGEDPCSETSLHRILIVPAKSAAAAVEIYEKCGFGQIGYAGQKK